MVEYDYTIAPSYKAGMDNCLDHGKTMIHYDFNPILDHGKTMIHHDHNSILGHNKTIIHHDFNSVLWHGTCRKMHMLETKVCDCLKMK